MNRHESLIQHDPEMATCRLCLEDEETTWHIAAECPAIVSHRVDAFKCRYVTQDHMFPTWTVQAVVGFLTVPTIAAIFSPNSGIE